MKKLISISLLLVGLLFLNDYLLKDTYWIMRLCKLIIMLFLPVLLMFKELLQEGFYVKTLSRDRADLRLGFRRLNPKSLSGAFLVGVLIVVILQITYMILIEFIDLTSLVDTFNETYKLSLNEFILASLYTIFINSFIEEFLFRGVIFLGFKNRTCKRDAYMLSAFIFSIYHMSIFGGWFSVWLTALMLLGLFIGGIIFNYVTEKSGGILSSWIIHLMADVGVVLVGMQMFNII